MELTRSERVSFSPAGNRKGRGLSVITVRASGAVTETMATVSSELMLNICASVALSTKTVPRLTVLSTMLPVLSSTIYILSNYSYDATPERLTFKIPANLVVEEQLRT